jgi:predicted ATP-grasp superfamily ATP-dependent carboligase
LEALAARFATVPIVYTGALDNHPCLIERLARRHPLWGNSAETLRAVRDPVRVARALRDAGIDCPNVRTDPRNLPRDGRWLIKPLKSAGGRKIAPLANRQDSLGEPSYYQERIDGLALSALFLGHAGDCELLGTTRQLVGRPGAPFAYWGSIGPCAISALAGSKLERIGRVLVAQFGLRGLFGIDFVLRDGIPWPVEVNPRYTASVEVLELATGVSFLELHRGAFAPRAGATATRPRESDSLVGKAIVFAEQPGTFPRAAIPPLARGSAEAFPMIADVPDPGTPFAPGEPVLTVFARGETADDCSRRLDRELLAWNRRIGAATMRKQTCET